MIGSCNARGTHGNNALGKIDMKKASLLVTTLVTTLVTLTLG
jgi:hypothetical protein